MLIEKVTTDVRVRTMPMYGYARVSTNGQDLSSQYAELMAAGCAKVFKEKISSAKTDRPELAKVIRRLEQGDVLVVTRLDRLARSTRDLLNVLDEPASVAPAFAHSRIPGPTPRRRMGGSC
jgi:DNA invertase Pin-like site-specific DNA recombinase